jgi:hypothetical protein
MGLLRLNIIVGGVDFVVWHDVERVDKRSGASSARAMMAYYSQRCLSKTVKACAIVEVAGLGIVSARSRPLAWSFWRARARAKGIFGGQNDA